ncbi:POLG isoform 14, partial [Pan troglodytes]
QQMYAATKGLRCVAQEALPWNDGDNTAPRYRLS